MMTQAVIQKEYKRLEIEKRRLEKTMRAFILRLRPEAGQNNLWSIGELGLKGGPRNLSAKLDFYLYKTR